MKPQDIFSLQQKLTLDAAKGLIGRKIATTAPEYKHNAPYIKVFTPTSFITEWDLAKKEKNVNGYFNRQEYWEKTLTPLRIEEKKNIINLIDERGIPQMRCRLGDFSEFSTPTFNGSDADRPVYYMVMNGFDLENGIYY